MYDIEKEKNKYRKLVEKKKNEEEKKKLKKIEHDIIKAYEEFDRNMINNCKIEPIKFEDDAIKKILIKNYTNNSFEIEQIKKEIKEDNSRIANNKCLYCMIGDLWSCDHYFPKEKYPEYSILSNNLIYVCDACNSTYKLNNKLYDECNNRNFYNLYYDKKIKYKFLYININLDNKVKLKVIFNFTDEDYETKCIIENHFKNLNLFNRYIKKCTDKLDEIRNLECGGKIKFQDFMEIEYNKLKNTYGENYWESAFYYSLKNLSDDEVFIFMDYLKKFNY